MNDKPGPELYMRHEIPIGGPLPDGWTWLSVHPLDESLSVALVPFEPDYEAAKSILEDMDTLRDPHGLLERNVSLMAWTVKIVDAALREVADE